VIVCNTRESADRPLIFCCNFWAYCALGKSVAHGLLTSRHGFVIFGWLFNRGPRVDHLIQSDPKFNTVAHRTATGDRGIMMRDKWINTTALVTGAVVAAIGATGAAAQSADVAALQARVAALETQAAARGTGAPDLKFNLGENTKIELYGFVRFEAFQDFDFAQGDLSRAARVGNPAFATDGDFETSVRVSRFGIRSTTETGIGQIGTQLEFDLFSGNDETTSPNPRLRHANVTIGDNWLFGQTWTNFMPLAHYPRTSDFNGPVGITFARVPQIRYSNTLANGLAYSFSVEESAAATSNDPVLTAAAGYSADKWSARVAGLTGRVDDGAGSDLTYSAYTLSGSVTPWEGGLFTASYTDGDAIGSLLIGPGDDIVNGATNDAEGVTLQFRQQISDKWNVGIAYGNENYAAAGASNTLGSQSVHLNTFYTPVDNLTLGLEYIFIEREDASGQKFDANRLGASVTFSF